MCILRGRSVTLMSLVRLEEGETLPYSSLPHITRQKGRVRQDVRQNSYTFDRMFDTAQDRYSEGRKNAVLLHRRKDKSPTDMRSLTYWNSGHTRKAEEEKANTNFTNYTN